MNTDILVSVVVPVYNSAAHLGAALSAIIAQDYTHIEIIIVDDASTDHSLDIAQSLLTDSGRAFRVIKHPKNLGVSAARNTGIASAQGKYIWFCDSDDLPESNFITCLIAEAEHKNADLVFCGIKQYHESQNKLVHEPITFSPDSCSPESYLNAWAEQKLSLWSIWNFLFSRDIITGNSLHFHEGCKIGEDTEFLLKAIAHASRISCVKEMLYTYCNYSGKLTDGRKNPELLRDMMLSRLRSGRYLLRHIHSKRVREYFLGCYLPDVTIKQFTGCAAANDREHYSRLKKTLKHRTIRKILLSTARFIFTVPELFCKSIMLLYAPDIYYRLRKE